MSLYDDPQILELLDTTELTQYFGFGGNSDASTGPRIGTVTVDPSVGFGVAAPLGSVAIRRTPGFVTIYLKTDVANTAWVTGLTPASLALLLVTLLPLTPPVVIGVDPGAGGAIAVDRSYSIVFTSALGAGTHIRTLAAPSFLGQQMTFWADATTITGAGDVQIDVATTVEATGLTKIRFHAFPGAAPASGINAPAPATQFTANVADGARTITERFLKLQAIQKGGLGWHVIQADGVAFIV
jgi:hypothetical protein